MKKHLLSAMTLSLMAALSHAADPAPAPAAPAPAAKGPTSGIAIEYIDASVRGQDDFFRYLNGKWLQSVEIPADRSSWGSFAKLRDDTQPQLRAIIEQAAAKNAKDGDEQRIGDYYASFMDEAKLETLGVTPLQAEFARIAALKDKKQIPALIGHLNMTGAGAPYAFYIHQDAKDSTRYVADLFQSGLGMPDRDYYLKEDDAKLAEARTKYLAHVEKMLGMAGVKDASASAKAILGLETELAKIQWSKVALRDPVKAYNKIELAKLAALAPGYDWNAYLKETGIAGKVKYLIVSQPSYIGGFNKLLKATPLDTWKAYFQWKVLNARAPYLGKQFADENFAFYGTVLTGVTQQQPRWKRGVAAVESAMGESVGKVYVTQHFPAERKARMEKLVANLLAAYKESIDTLDWMSPATKKEAHAKLAKFTTKIGYPNKWKDYSTLKVSRDDLVGNVTRANLWSQNFDVAKLGKPVDRDEWIMTPQTVNAYYNPELNEIVFPASILQPPFFDANADDAVNYGGIGAVIGHEISHGFDDQGSQYDGDGNLRNWWSKEDAAAFKAKTGMLVKQYSAFSPLQGLNVNGELTLGENIGDNSGLAVAYKAYKLSLGGKPAPVIDGMSGDQRFYMGWAQVWRTKVRDPQMMVLLKTDPHSPGMYRANGTLRNQPGFYEAFGVKEGDKMYLPPKDRVIIW